jgi:hypothetical protein
VSQEPPEPTRGQKAFFLFGVAVIVAALLVALAFAYVGSGG